VRRSLREARLILRGRFVYTYNLSKPILPSKSSAPTKLRLLVTTRKEENRKERRKCPAFDFSRKEKLKKARCDWSAHRVFGFLFVGKLLFFLFISSRVSFFFFFFFFFWLITISMVGGVCFLLHSLLFLLLFFF